MNEIQVVCSVSACPLSCKAGTEGPGTDPRGGVHGWMLPLEGSVSAFFSLTVHSAQMFVTPLKIHVLHACAVSFFFLQANRSRHPKRKVIECCLQTGVGSWCPKNSSTPSPIPGSNFHPFELNVFCNS